MKDPLIMKSWSPYIVGIFFGALLSATLSRDHTNEAVPAMWRARFGSSVSLRLISAFFAGALMLFGARLADGCTSGHGISGNMQLAISSFAFSAMFFASATVKALILYGRNRATHV